MGEHGNRRAERANEYLSKAGRERIQRLREQAQQISDYLRVRQAGRLRPSCERGIEMSERSGDR